MKYSMKVHVEDGVITHLNDTCFFGAKKSLVDKVFSKPWDLKEILVDHWEKIKDRTLSMPEPYFRDLSHSLEHIKVNAIGEEGLTDLAVIDFTQDDYLFWVDVMQELVVKTFSEPHNSFDEPIPVLWKPKNVYQTILFVMNNYRENKIRSM